MKIETQAFSKMFSNTQDSSWDQAECSVDTPKVYIVSPAGLNQLIMAYSCDHSQLVEFSFTTRGGTKLLIFHAHTNACHHGHDPICMYRRTGLLIVNCEFFLHL